MSVILSEIEPSEARQERVEGPCVSRNLAPIIRFKNHQVLRLRRLIRKRISQLLSG